MRIPRGRATDPDSPVRFDSTLNEYHILQRVLPELDGLPTVYHRPFCGHGARVEVQRFDYPKSGVSILNSVQHADLHRGAARRGAVVAGPACRPGRMPPSVRSVPVGRPGARHSA